MIQCSDSISDCSPGCQFCQRGTWLCIYLTYLCSANCPFCPAPIKNQDVIKSAFGNNPKTILQWVNKASIEGISFSGGDSFLVFDRFLKWLKLFKEHHPEIYYWAYTNGLNCELTQLDLLARHGLDELRFNLAASGYKNRFVLANVKEACQRFQHVTIEIPSIPADLSALIDILPELEDMGIHFMNLHEYILVALDPASSTAFAATFLLNKIDKIKYHAYSVINSHRIKDYCEQRHPSFHINICSLQQKENQLLQRRLKMGKLLKYEYETLTEEGLLSVTIPVTDADILTCLETLTDVPAGWFDWETFIKESVHFKSEISPLAFFEFLLLPPLSSDEPRRLLSKRRVRQCLI